MHKIIIMKSEVVSSSAPDLPYIRDLVSRFGSRSVGSLRQAFGFLRDSTVEQKKCFASLNVFDEDLLPTDLQSDGEEVRVLALLCTKSICEDDSIRLDFINSPAYRVISEMFRRPLHINDAPQEALIPPPGGDQNFLQSRELSTILTVFLTLLESDLDEIRVKLVKTEGFLDRVKELATSKDGRIVTLSVAMIPALIRNRESFLAVLGKGFLPLFPEILKEGIGDVSTALSSVWNSCVFEEGVTMFLEMGIPSLLLEILFDEPVIVQCINHAEQGRRRSVYDSVASKHHKAAGALAEMCLTSSNARKHVLELDALEKLMPLIERLSQSGTFNNSKFSLLLACSLIYYEYLNSCVKEDDNPFDDSVLVKCIRKFILENDNGRSHGWGWDALELTCLSILLRCSVAAVRLFAMWTIGCALRCEKGTNSELSEVFNSTGMRHTVIHMCESNDMLEKSVSASLLMVLDGFELGNGLKEDIEGLVNDEEFHDVLFVVRGVEVPSHGVVVFSRCQKLLELPSETNVDGIIRLVLPESVSESVFRSFLEYCYSGLVNVDFYDIRDAISFAIYFDLPTFKWMCEDQIIGTISVRNVLDICKWARELNCEETVDKCKLFALQDENFQILLDSVSRDVLVSDLGKETVEEMEAMLENDTKEVEIACTLPVEKVTDVGSTQQPMMLLDEELLDDSDMETGDEYSM